MSIEGCDAQLTLDGREDRWLSFNAHARVDAAAPRPHLFDTDAFRDLTYSGKCSQPAMIEEVSEL